MCTTAPRWQINRPDKPGITVCNDHLGHMIERLAGEAGANFQFSLMYVHGISGFIATCLHNEKATGMIVPLTIQNGQQKVLRVPEERPQLAAHPSVELVPKT